MSLRSSGLRDFASSAMTMKYRRPTEPSYPAKASIQYAAVYRFYHCCLWNTGSPAFAGDDKRVWDRILAARFASEACQRHPRKQRAQGRPGARCTRGLVCNCAQKTRTRAYRFSGEHSGLPCAMALRLTSSSCVRKICQNVRTGGSDQPPVAGSDPVRAQRPRACRGARDRSGVFLNPNSCTGFEPEPSKEGSG